MAVAQTETPEVMRALDLEGEGKFREAAQLFHHALHAQPTPGALLGLERVYAELGITDSLLAPLDSLITRQPREPLYRSVKLRTLQILRREPELRGAFESWVAVAPRDPAPYREYSRLLLRLGRATTADSVVQEGRRALGGGRELEFETAQLRAAQGQWQASAVSWKRVLDGSPDLAGAASYALAPTPAALREPVSGIFLAPPVTRGSRRAIAELRLTWGDAQGAWDALRVLAPDSATAATWAEFGGRALSEERFAIARDALASAVRARRTPALAMEAATAALRAGSPTDVFALLPLNDDPIDSARAARDLLPLHVEALAALGRGADAAALVARYERWLAPAQRTTLARMLASAWVRAGDLARARDALRAAGPDADSSDAAAWIALYEGRLGDARTLMQRVRDPSPALAVALGVVGRTRKDSAPSLGAAFLALSQGDSAGAATRFVAAAAEAPDAASVVLLVAARLDAARHDEAAAAALWQRIVTEFGETPEATESELEWARLLRRRGETAGAVTHLEHLILNAPQSALLPQARRELELAKGGLPSP